MRDIRLGDDIDDFCVRCKRVMNHNVVSVLNGQAAKVRCRTCHSDHDFRHEQPPPPKVDARKAALGRIKRLIRDGESRDLDSSLDAETIAIAASAAGAEGREGVRAFRERRPPRFHDEPVTS